jgi:hypothetical protein
MGDALPAPFKADVVFGLIVEHGDLRWSRVVNVAALRS